MDARLKELNIERSVVKYGPTVSPISACRNDIFIRSVIVYKTPIATCAGLFFDSADTDKGTDICNIKVCEHALRAPYRPD
jgi:hypothetical protein